MAAQDRVGNRIAASRENPLLSYLALFTSLGTLLCCALPSLLVLLGMGATAASFLAALPWLVTLATEHCRIS